MMPVSGDALAYAATTVSFENLGRMECSGNLWKELAIVCEAAETKRAKAFLRVWEVKRGPIFS